MITAKENYMMALNHEKPMWVPNAISDVVGVGGTAETFDNGPHGGGYDGFGVLWHCTESAAGQAVPAAGHIVLDDICDWEDKVTFPDVDSVDWKAMGERLKTVDRNEKVVEYGCWNGHFLRLTHLMGFENALCAMFTDPEACKAFMDAFTEYKIKVVERVAEYIKPDLFTSYDDTATEIGTFMSPASYREIIKPYHKKLNDAVKAYGMIPMMHTCGRCEEIVPDFIDEGAYAWTAAQPTNDIAGILRKYGKQITVIGGYDTNGLPGLVDVSDDVIDAEVKRCVETYAPYGSYIFHGFRMVPGTVKEFFEAMIPISAAADKYGKEFYK